MSKDNSVSEADGIKYSEIHMYSGSQPERMLGAGPKFKRKRSFWRAYRRKEVWALVSYATKEMMRKIEHDLYDNAIPDKHVCDGVMYVFRK